MNPRRVLTVVCNELGLREQRVLAGRRSHAHVIARRMSIAFAAARTVHSQADIAEALGVDYSTVVRALTVHARELVRNASYARAVRMIEHALDEASA